MKNFIDVFCVSFFAVIKHLPHKQAVIMIVFVIVIIFS